MSMGTVAMEPPETAIAVASATTKVPLTEGGPASDKKVGKPNEKLSEKPVEQKGEKPRKQPESEAKSPTLNEPAEAASSPHRLLDHPALWRAGQLRRPEQAHRTGFRPLDRHLWGRGWPKAGLTELLHSGPGIGELRLLMPALARLSRQEQRWVTWVNPPAIPYAPALEAAGVAIDRMLLVHPNNHRDALWSVEQACKGGTSSMVLAWLDERQLQDKDTRRLQLAARQGNTSLFLFRPPEAAARASMAELRLLLSTADGISGNDAGQETNSPLAATDQLQLSILKRRGGWPVEKLGLTLSPDVVSCRKETLQAQLQRWRQRHLRPVREVAERALCHAKESALQAGQAG